MSHNVQQLLTEHIDLWTSSIENKSSAGRGSSRKKSLYGIKKLRELILELAVRGKLVEQNPDDEPASELLKRIEAERDQLVKDGNIKKPKKLPKINEEEKLFELPNGWDWSRIAEIAEITPRNNINDETEVSFVPMPLISKSHDGSHEHELKIWSEIKKGYTHFANGDIAIAKITPCFENSKAAIFTNLINGVGAGTTELHVARPYGEHINRKFILLYLKAPQFLLVGETKMTGSAGQKRVPKDFFAYNLLPFPPLPEQHRIVAKVDELMTLCDQLEQQTEQQLDAHQLLVDTLLGTLTQSQNANELADNWTRLSLHFDTLFTTEASIDQLKQTILQLAVMGKLVPQNPNDEPASELLKRIAAEKEQLIKDKKIKKQKPLPPISDEEKSFELPKGWEWCRFADYAVEVATGPFGSMINKREYVTGGVPLINPSHMSKGKVIEDEQISVTSKKADELSSYVITEGDVVMARRGEMGRCAIVTNRESGWLCGTGSFVLKFTPDIDRNYVFTLFSARNTRKYLSSESVGATMTNLNHGILNKMPLMIPAIPEQHRIVSKVNELFTLCDQLKERLQHNQQTQLLLTDTLVQEALV
jgi:type I restriction enzyme S subunit